MSFLLQKVCRRPRSEACVSPKVVRVQPGPHHRPVVAGAALGGKAHGRVEVTWVTGGVGKDQAGRQEQVRIHFKAIIL